MARFVDELPSPMTGRLESTQACLFSSEEPAGCYLRIVNIAESELKLEEESFGILELPLDAADRFQPDFEISVITATPAIALDKPCRRSAASIGGKPRIDAEPIVHCPSYEKRRVVVADTQLDTRLQTQILDDFAKIEMGADNSRIRAVCQTDPHAPALVLESALGLLRRLRQYWAAKNDGEE